ncbi:MAG: Amidinotransferase [Bacteroidetes bacterium]|nr:Amidinotransferase [Bacteroidota bacterium]
MQPATKLRIINTFVIMQQKPSNILMIRPVSFGFNKQTAESNSFQQTAEELAAEFVQQKARKEFDAFAALLQTNHIDVLIFDDTLFPETPDAIFPNNWISFQDSNIVLYPMLAENRRLERRMDIVDHFKKAATGIIDLRAYEQKGQFLEGTGSIVFDYENKIAYANSSPRTDKKLFDQLCKQLGYRSILFKAVDANGADIYHTNVLMCIGKHFAVICKECIAADSETVIASLKTTGHEIIEISYVQMNSFAGNIYQLFNADGESFIVMSEQAYQSLNKAQVNQLEKYGTLLHSPLDTIEKHGGGSARCMMLVVSN